MLVVANLGSAEVKQFHQMLRTVFRALRLLQDAQRPYIRPIEKKTICS